jgi:hypothetical protein
MPSTPLLVFVLDYEDAKKMIHYCSIKYTAVIQFGGEWILGGSPEGTNRI